MNFGIVQKSFRQVELKCRLLKGQAKILIILYCGSYYLSCQILPSTVFPCHKCQVMCNSSRKVSPCTVSNDNNTGHIHPVFGSWVQEADSNIVAIIKLGGINVLWSLSVAIKERLNILGKNMLCWNSTMVADGVQLSNLLTVSHCMGLYGLLPNLNSSKVAKWSGEGTPVEWTTILPFSQITCRFY